MTDKDVATVLTAMSQLSLRERRVLALRFGLGSGRMMTIRDVAHRLSMQQDEVRKIEAYALRYIAAHASEAT